MAKGAAVQWITPTAALAACAAAVPAAFAVGTPAPHAKNGDTHVTGQSIDQTLDCNDSTLLVDGMSNTVNVLGTSWAGWDETVVFHNGDPYIWDRGRELGMTNRLMRAPA